MIDGISDLLADEGFRTGLRFGLAALAAAALVALAASGVARRRACLPVAGVAFAAAALSTVDDVFEVDRDLVVATVVLVVGPFLAQLVLRRRPEAWAVAAVPGALLFAQAAEIPGLSWDRTVIALATLVGGALVADFDAAHGSAGLPPAMLALTVLGAYVTTPETQTSILLAGAALPIALLGWPASLGSLGAGGAFAATALVSWVVVLDGNFRPGAVVGGITALGMFVVEPVVRRVWRREATHQWMVVAGLHVVLVGACTRVAGLLTSAIGAAVIVAIAYAIAAVILVVAEQRPTRPAHLARGTSAFAHSD
jgi:hypothetical protein